MYFNEEGLYSLTSTLKQQGLWLQSNWQGKIPSTSVHIDCRRIQKNTSSRIPVGITQKVIKLLTCSQDYSFIINLFRALTIIFHGTNESTRHGLNKNKIMKREQKQKNYKKRVSVYQTVCCNKLVTFALFQNCKYSAISQFLCCILSNLLSPHSIYIQRRLCSSDISFSNVKLFFTQLVCIGCIRGQRGFHAIRMADETQGTQSTCFLCAKRTT